VVVVRVSSRSWLWGDTGYEKMVMVNYWLSECGYGEIVNIRMWL